jgi:hypothetical protein
MSALGCNPQETKAHIERRHSSNLPEPVANTSLEPGEGAEPKRVEEALSDILERAPHIWL